MKILYSLVAVLPLVAAWAPVRPVAKSSTTALGMKPTTRQAFVNSLIARAIVTSTGALPSFADETLPNGVSYKVIKDGTGPKPEIGELIAIRFKAFCGEQKIDDIFDTPEPYYTRLGSCGLIKGVEQTLPLMKLGDRWELTIPVSNRNQVSNEIVRFGTLQSCCNEFRIWRWILFLTSQLKTIFHRVNLLSVRMAAPHLLDDLVFLETQRLPLT